MEILEKDKIEVSGTLKDYKANKHGDIDAMELALENEILKLNFPPHTAKVVMEAIKQGDKVRLTYQEKRPKHDFRGDKKLKLKLQSLMPYGQEEIVISALHPAKPDGNQLPEHLAFENFELLKDEKGNLTGIRSGNKLLHVHKEDKVLSDLINSNSKLEISAIKRVDDGFVNENHQYVYHLQNIIINGKKYSSKR